MRRGHSGRVDSNHKDVVEAFRAAGCSVLSLASIGSGAPDLVVGTDGFNVLVEVKAQKGQRNEAQRKFDHDWNGWIEVIRSTEEAVALVQRLRGAPRQQAQQG